MPHLLYLEHDPEVRAGTEQHLRAESFEVTACAAARDALAALDRVGRTLDAALLDLHPPDMDGLGLLRAFRSARGLPTLLLTSRTEDIDRVLDAGLGAEDYVSRPYSGRELAARVKAILRRAAAAEGQGKEPAPAFGPITLDPEQRAARLAGVAMELTRKEYELLAHFLANPHRVLSRERLLHEVWDLEYLGESRTIDAHVRRLRAKLGEHAPLIETVVGVGYRLGGADT